MQRVILNEGAYRGLEPVFDLRNVSSCVIFVLSLTFEDTALLGRQALTPLLIISRFD